MRDVARELPQAGELLAVEAIDRTGLLVTSEGAFVRVLRVTPPNPLILADDERARIAAGFADVLGRLRPGQSLQFYIDARPVRLAEVLRDARAQVEAAAGPIPNGDRPAADATALSRWRLQAAVEESLRRHADDQAAVELAAYVVVPTQSRPRGLRHALRRALKGDAPLERGLAAHRRAARDSQARADTVRGGLEHLRLPVRQLNGAELYGLLWARMNPTSADSTRSTASAPVEILGELDAARDREQARAAALALRAAIASSSMDLKRDRHLVEVERDVEQVIHAQTTAQQTSLGWLLSAMLTRQPYTLSVHVHALDRRRERQRIKLGYRRLFAVNRGAEQRGRVPDYDRYAQEREFEQLLTDMAGHERANLFEVSIYQSLRAPGPRPDLDALGEAVDGCVEAIEATADCRVARGEFHQRELWSSTLPVGRDVARRVRRYATRNAADTVPLTGTSCGSPNGIPFAFTDPGHTLERLDPYDPEHTNHTMVLAGRSGSGKTLTANLLLARSIPLGASAFVIDRAGHYEFLTRLIGGARQIDLGRDTPSAINPWDVPDPANVPREKIAFLLSLHTLMMGDDGLGKTELAQLGEGIRAVYARAAALGGSVRPRELLLRDELVAMARLYQDEGAAELAAVARNLAIRLGEWCGDGTYAYLLDRPTTVATDSPLVVFDTRRCPQDVLRPVMFAILEHVTSTVERRWQTHLAGGPRAGGAPFAGRSVLLVDEAWHLVRSQETGTYANDLALRARHLGLWFIALFQQLSQADTEHGHALLQNATMQLYLAQHPSELDFMQRASRLSDAEREVVARLETVKGSHAQALWINGTRGRGRVSIRVGPTEYWAFTSDQGRDAAIREAALREHDGDAWAAIAALARRRYAPDHAGAT